MTIIVVFTYLQALDVLTTLLGLRLGLGEGSPFVRLLLQTGTVDGLLLSKAIAGLACAVCIFTNRRRVLLWANYWYAALVAWNLMVIMLGLSAAIPR